MQDIIGVVLSYLVGVWRYRWLIVAVPALASPVGWFYVATLPDQYQADAKVYVDTDSVLNPLMKGIAVRLDDNRRISMMTRLLFTKEIMERLARMTDQDLKAKTPQQMDEVVASLKSRVRLSRQSGNIYRLGFADESPELAKRVVQAFLTIFVETNLGESRKDQDSAEQFLLREAKEYERRLVTADRKLKEFKARNMPYISDRGDYFEELQDMKSKLETVRLEAQMAGERRDELKEQLAVVESEGLSALKADEEAMPSPLEKRIQALQLQLDDILIRYTERHPDVVYLRKAIARLKVQQQHEDQLVYLPEEEGVFDAQKVLATSPIYQQMKLLVTEAEGEVASREAIVNEYERRIEHLKKEVDRVLEVEIEQKQLNRDYGIVKGKHNALLQRLESLRLGRQVDTSAETVRFRVIEPPKVPDKPSGPNRSLFSSLIFGGGLGIGLALAVVISLFRPTYSNRKQLNESTGVPVLGSINMIWDDVQKRKRRLLNVAYAMSFMLLLLAYGAVLVVYKFDIAVLSRIPVL